MRPRSTKREALGRIKMGASIANGLEYFVIVIVYVLVVVFAAVSLKFR